MISYSEYYKSVIDFLNVEIKLMTQLASNKGFYDFYKSMLPAYSSEVNCFNACNVHYKILFGEYRFASFHEFKRKYSLDVSELELKRNYILGWFKLKDFKTFENFYPVVLVIFPELTKEKLLQFWSKSELDPEVIQKVECVKQIIG